MASKESRQAFHLEVALSAMVLGVLGAPQKNPTALLCHTMAWCARQQGRSACVLQSLAFWENTSSSQAVLVLQAALVVLLLSRPPQVEELAAWVVFGDAALSAPSLGTLVAWAARGVLLSWVVPLQNKASYQR
jgi:hypothetical protein